MPDPELRIVSPGLEERFGGTIYDHSLLYDPERVDYLSAIDGLLPYQAVIPPAGSWFLHYPERTNAVGPIFECPGILYTDPPAIVWYVFGPAPISMLNSPTALPVTGARLWWDTRTGYGDGPALAALDPQPAWLLWYVTFRYAGLGVGTPFTCPTDGEGGPASAATVAAASAAAAIDGAAGALTPRYFSFVEFSASIGELEYDTPDVDWWPDAREFTLGVKRPEDHFELPGYDGDPENPLTAYLWRPSELPSTVTIVGETLGAVNEQSWSQVSLLPFKLDTDPSGGGGGGGGGMLPSTVLAGPRTTGVVPIRGAR